VSAPADGVSLRPSQRRRSDLGLLRISFALAVAPLGPIALVGVPVAAILGTFALIVAGIIAIAATIWSLLFGLLYLNTVARVRGVVGRAECILLGACTAFLLPAATLAAGYAWDALHDAFLFSPWTRWGNGLSTVVVFGGVFLPFGALGGWIFWGIGVKPAAVPTTDFAAVFE
jgi:hypothetical protein